MVKMALQVGTEFDNFDVLMSTIQLYEEANFVNLIIRDTRRVEVAAKRNLRKTYNPAIKYSDVSFCCTYGGKKFVSQSTGKRNYKTIKKACPFSLKVRATSDGQKLLVREFCEDHNHNINEAEFRMHPKQRKLDPGSQEEIANLLSLEPDKRLLRKRLMEATGKVILMKDIHNIKTRLLAGKKEDTNKVVSDSHDVRNETMPGTGCGKQEIDGNGANKPSRTLRTKLDRQINFTGHTGQSEAARGETAGEDLGNSFASSNSEKKGTESDFPLSSPAEPSACSMFSGSASHDQIDKGLSLSLLPHEAMAAAAQPQVSSAIRQPHTLTTASNSQVVLTTDDRQREATSSVHPLEVCPPTITHSVLPPATTTTVLQPYTISASIASVDGQSQHQSQEHEHHHHFSQQQHQQSGQLFEVPNIYTVNLQQLQPGHVYTISPLNHSHHYLEQQQQEHHIPHVAVSHCTNIPCASTPIYSHNVADDPNSLASTVSSSVSGNGSFLHQTATSIAPAENHWISTPQLPGSATPYVQATAVGGTQSGMSPVFTNHPMMTSVTTAPQPPHQTISYDALNTKATSTSKQHISNPQIVVNSSSTAESQINATYPNNIGSIQSTQNRPLLHHQDHQKQKQHSVLHSQNQQGVNKSGIVPFNLDTSHSPTAKDEAQASSAPFSACAKPDKKKQLRKWGRAGSGGGRKTRSSAIQADKDELVRKYFQQASVNLFVNERLKVPGTNSILRSISASRVKMSEGQAELKYNDALKPLAWLFGKWRSSDDGGKGKYPTINDFNYGEEAEFAPIGLQPNIEYKLLSRRPDNKATMHVETGVIKIKPGTNHIAFLASHNFGVVEVQEGKVVETELNVKSQSLGRTSFNKDPQVTGTTRSLKLVDGKLEHVMEMETEKTKLTEHLRVTYTKV